MTWPPNKVLVPVEVAEKPLKPSRKPSVIKYAILAVLLLLFCCEFIRVELLIRQHTIERNELQIKVKQLEDNPALTKSSYKTARNPLRARPNGEKPLERKNYIQFVQPNITQEVHKILSTWKNKRCFACPHGTEGDREEKGSNGTKPESGLELIGSVGPRDDKEIEEVKRNESVQATPRWRVVFDFENGRADMDKWTRTGTAFNNQPTYGDNPTARNRGQPSNHNGNWWIGGAENRPSQAATAGAVQGDGPQGTMTSQPFVITGNKLRFLIGGGCDGNVARVELLIGGRVVAQATGKCTETMTTHEWDVDCRHVGLQAQVRLVDSSSGGWGHINFDHLEILDQPIPEWYTLFDFENGRADMEKWTLTGTVFNNQPTYGDNPTARNRGQPSNHKGNWWIGGAENRPRQSATAGTAQWDGPQGTMTSPPFVMVGNKLKFLIGGGCDVNFARAELLIGGRVVAKATGKCTETMTTHEWNVDCRNVGHQAQVRLVDSSSGGWGHINFDHFEIYGRQKPGINNPNPTQNIGTNQLSNEPTPTQNVHTDDENSGIGSDENNSYEDNYNGSGDYGGGW